MATKSKGKKGPPVREPGPKPVPKKAVKGVNGHDT
jgi:hypothetical protein